MTVMLGVVIGAIIALLIMSAFFSGSETALTATSRASMHELERRGDRRATIVETLMQHRERLLGAILLGNNLVNILASAIATQLFLDLFGSVGVAYATIVMTMLVLVFSEVLPKTYAIINPDRVALAVAPLIRLFVALFAPVVMAIEFIVKQTLRIAGADITKARSILSPHEEIRGAIDLHHKEGTVVKKTRDMLGGILDLRELELSDVMVHRTKMHTIDASRPPAEIIDDVLRSGHSRVPVWKDNPDNIIGILHAKELLAALQQQKGKAESIDIEGLCSQPWFVPDTTSVADQLNAFLRRKAHFALVVDEYGEVMGLVTLEDVLEEIVGDISDEHDIVASGIRPEASGSYVVDGAVPIRDLNRSMDWELPDEEATTIAGLVIHEAQMIPDVGQAFTFHGFRFEVLRKRRNQLTALRITPLKPAEG
ncbi:HlyC/CorC family transporter [Kaustia mangrovi]|uniref:HlyC/CorC family transporter n=1 Tax=Kaustia mangrovi TaxID=2593653 RepID=A0A7S8C2Z9_9HYPH|nr:HlyC/CorC family transporter [Kaustia mangrovi]QPC42429.1 HlyC/CorC family transporter [Kaustia mangrovi]